MSQMYSAVGAAKARRAARFIEPDGRSTLIALDFQASSGQGPELDVITKVAAGGANGVLATWHLARRYPEAFARTGLILRIDGGLTDMGGYASGDVFSLLYEVEQAAVIGADGVVIMAYPGADDEELSLRRLTKLAGECEMIGMPLIVESIPGGWKRAVPWETEFIARCARVCVELGADMIKTPAPPKVEEIADVVAVTQAPVVVLGGPKMDSEDEAVEFAAAAVAAGAAGIAFGRNCWGAGDPEAMVRRLYQAVHG